MIRRNTIKNLISMLILMMLLVPINFAQGSGYDIDYNNDYDESLSAGDKKSGERISINVMDADIRDVLSALALKMNKNIILVEQPTRVTLKVDNITPFKALELLVQSQGMGYLQEGSIIVVGYLSRLRNDFFRQMILTRFNLRHITVDTLLPLIDQLNIPLQYISVSSNPNAVWVQGTPQALYKVDELIKALDLWENNEQPMVIHYILNNISAYDAAERLMLFNFEDVRTVVFAYPEIGSEILIICPPHLETEMNSILASIDEVQKTIRVPVDSATGENAYQSLSARRNLLSQLTGIPVGKIHISENLSSDSESVYCVLWVEETPDNIQKIRRMVDLIDSP